MALEYTIVLRGQPFVLTEDLISADGPNYFTACFKGGYSENETRMVRLGRSPALFMLIIDHLSGYEILPIHENALPPNMTEEMAMKNLYADALFYGLEGLQSKLSTAMTPQNPPEPIKVDPPPPSHRYILVVRGSSPPFPISEDSRVEDIVTLPDTSYPIGEALALQLIAKHGVDHRRTHFMADNAITRRPGWGLAASWTSIVSCAADFDASVDIEGFFLLLVRE